MSYLLFSESQIEQAARNKFVEITKLRPIKTWDSVSTEYVRVSSCGDELFRDRESLVRAVTESKRSEKKEFNQVVHVLEEQIDIIGSFMSYTDSASQEACVIYRACVLRTIPFVFKKIEYQYYFSTTPSDFHSMYYNGQSVSSSPYYIWFLGTWLEIGGEIEDLYGE